MAETTSASDEKIPVTLWLTFDQICSLYDGSSKDICAPSKAISEALKSSADFKQKSQDKLLQLQLTQAFLSQNQQMRTLLNQSASALTAFQKNYEKDKKKIEKLKKQVKEGRKEKERSKSASLGGSNSQPLSTKEDEGEKKEHKSKHRRQKSMDSHSRRIASRNLSSTSKSSSKKDLTELVNGGNKTST
eukprot:TRINITY_DN5191_c0_g1_i1.p1 TRINITY_DN5191_c0_g1~~TRINITY_DN5191_c0_g1_i1.p1  ORF type:complete len:189 (-),score=49.36 TRINITY_DN5191_c0_g1_i1:428-994(-)